MTGTAKRLGLEILGWLMLVAGVAALFLPGPGLLLLFGGLALLSQQYAWAERWVEPVRLRALRGAAEGVETWPRIIASTLGALCIGGFGLLWLIDPPTPEWWPLPDAYWMLGGTWTGVTLLVSFVIALALLVVSYRRFHGKPEAVAALECEIEEADDDWEDHRSRPHSPRPRRPGNDDEQR